MRTLSFAVYVLFKVSAMTINVEDNTMALQIKAHGSFFCCLFVFVFAFWCAIKLTFFSQNFCRNYPLSFGMFYIK